PANPVDKATATTDRDGTRDMSSREIIVLTSIDDETVVPQDFFDLLSGDCSAGFEMLGRRRTLSVHPLQNRIVRGCRRHVGHHCVAKLVQGSLLECVVPETL